MHNMLSSDSFSPLAYGQLDDNHSDKFKSPAHAPPEAISIMSLFVPKSSESKIARRKSRRFSKNYEA